MADALILRYVTRDRSADFVAVAAAALREFSSDRSIDRPVGRERDQLRKRGTSRNR